ncbi:MAG TPA: hypothetical protein VGL09_04450 [Methylomirabilota bacterium]
MRAWLTATVLAWATSSCATISTTSMPYVGAAQRPPTDPMSVQILQAMPAAPYERLGEISVTASTSPAPAMSDIEQKLREKAAALGADAAVVVYDGLQPIGAYISGGLWWPSDRTVYPVTGRRLVAVAIKYQAGSGRLPSTASVERPTVVFAERAAVIGTVESIDQGRRTVTLKRPDGQILTLKAPADAKNFDQIHPGDAVRAEYLDAVAVALRQASAPPPAGETAAVAVAPRGGKPEATVVDTVALTARVEAIDYGSRTVTLRGLRGDRRIVKVDDRVQGLNDVKPGDEVVVRHTEAIATTFSK